MEPEEVVKPPAQLTEDARAECLLSQFVQRLEAMKLDFVVITRMPGHGMQWATSDRSWARGSCNRLDTMLDELERIEQRREKEGS